MIAEDSILLLHCDAKQHCFTMATHGGEWRRVFQSLEDALTYAGMVVRHETRLTIYNELGKRMVDTTVHPREAAMV